MKKNKKKDLIGFDSNPTVFKKFDVPIPGEEKEKKKKTEWDDLDIKGPCKDPNMKTSKVILISLKTILY